MRELEISALLDDLYVVNVLMLLITIPDIMT